MGTGIKLDAEGQEEFENLVIDLETSIKILKHILSEYFSHASPETAALAYLVYQAGRHAEDIHKLVLPEMGVEA